MGYLIVLFTLCFMFQAEDNARLASQNDSTTSRNSGILRTFLRNPSAAFRSPDLEERLALDSQFGFRSYRYVQDLLDIWEPSTFQLICVDLRSLSLRSGSDRLSLTAQLESRDLTDQ
ncbi:hypothetical protein F4860DRAFT_492024 [Xylaria cubensis]|nr:hypothetical protein F4860DRAFT_492024 [Xylaria cubensis]